MKLKGSNLCCCYGIIYCIPNINQHKKFKKTFEYWLKTEKFKTLFDLVITERKALGTFQKVFPQVNGKNLTWDVFLKDLGFVHLDTFKGNTGNILYRYTYYRK